MLPLKAIARRWSCQSATCSMRHTADMISDGGGSGGSGSAHHEPVGHSSLYIQKSVPNTFCDRTASICAFMISIWAIMLW
jgi:hypothetical protein